MKAFRSFVSKHKIAILSVIIVVLAVVLVAVIIRFNSSGGQKFPPKDESSNAPLIRKPKGEISGDTNILVLCEDEDGETPLFIVIFDFRVYSEKILLTFLSPDNVYNGRSYSDAYLYGGIDALVDSVENVRERPIDRYFVMDKDGFCGIVDIMGEVTVNVTENYTYTSSDRSYDIEAGINDLDSYMLYSYIKLNLKKSDGLNAAAALIRDVVNEYLSRVKESDAEDLFCDLSNCVDTDFTITDYYSCRADIEYIISRSVRASLS